MKSNLLHMRLSILLGFVSLGVLDLAEMFAMHWVPREIAIRVQTVTGLLSLTIVGICAYLLTARAAPRVSPKNPHSASHRMCVNMQPQAMASGGRSHSAALEARWSRQLTVLEEQISALP